MEQTQSLLEHSTTEVISDTRKRRITVWLRKYGKYAILAALVIVPLFGYLGTLPIRLWDESRLASNAFEMYDTGHLLVTTFEYSPDLWNTKPPLLIWLQAGLMKVLGVNEWAVRLPSAVAGLLTCSLLLYLSRRYLNSFWFGFIALLVLVTSEGYITEHGTRTGDYDALLTLFTTLSALAFFAYCETTRNKYLYLVFAATALAVLTKSIAGFLFVPALGIYAIIRGQVLPLLQNKHFYIGLLGCLGVIAGYYLLREAVSPGYLQAVWHNELGGRYLQVNENHSGDFWFYYYGFMELKLTAWYLLVPCGFAVGLLLKNHRMNRLALFCAVMVVGFFLVISVSKTKLHWYDIPLYPFLSLLIAMVVYAVFDALRHLTWVNQHMRSNIWPFVFLFLLAINPYRKTLDRTYTPEENPGDKVFFDIGYFLKDALKGKQDITGYSLLYEGFNTHNLFYLYALRDNGTRLDFQDWTNLKPGELVIVPQEHIKQYVREHYEQEVVEEIGTITKFRIHGKKQ
ncbi:phospholipid carrier-dependent glycosyltransferase [Nibribacter ruber]|uniref:Phospholipid carrier-dependent glycosyltransferase n=1 Tax=Nibribacter ruber TaxID=2698458 RepID=A0A6P1P1P7_9BACT|nr:glycosyltransferase family 39 protein [Nibribacter ruber]QHL88023.1 phospholipid carrier-dependent glycosyltransferase [Nibribacter ruber]